MRVALIGCGDWGRHILRDLVTLGCEVPVVARSDASRRRAGEGGASMIVDASHALPPVDGIVIATPIARHLQTIDEVIDRGVPLFIEKPVATSADVLRRLDARAGGRLFVMHKWRYHPGVEYLRDLARSMELGPIVSLALTRSHWGNRHLDTDIVWVLAPHDLSIVLEILGEIPPPRWAIAERIDGVFESLTGVLGGNPPVSIMVSARAERRCREVRMGCRDGVAVLADSYDDAIAIYRRGAEVAVPIEERRKISTELPLLRELRAFVEHLRGGPPPRSSITEEIQVVGAIEQLRAIAAAGAR